MHMDNEDREKKRADPERVLTPLEQLKDDIESRKHEIKLVNKAKRFTDWDDPDDVRYWMREHKRRRRLKTIRHFRPDLRCPICRMIRLRPRQWVLIPGLQRTVICLACYRKREAKSKVDKTLSAFVFEEDLVSHTELYYRLKPEIVIAARKKMALGQVKFANLIGWGIDLQKRIEKGRAFINQPQMNKYIKLLHSHGIRFKISPIRQSEIAQPED